MKLLSNFVSRVDRFFISGSLKSPAPPVESQDKNTPAILTDAECVELPLYHYRHLKRLADLRRCSLEEAIEYVIHSVDPVSDNWIDRRWGTCAETRIIKTRKRHDERHLIEVIQGLPVNIRPVTDGPYLEDFEFFTDEPGLLGIRAEGVNILDFETANKRDDEVFRLVRDMLPDMTTEQYHIYNTFNSQYLRLIREPFLFTMPDIQAPAIDAGCYVGYKALAMAKFVGQHDVLAFEVESDNYHVLNRNAGNNPAFNIKPVRAALSNSREGQVLNTRNTRTMAHSLADFGELKEADTSLLSGHNRQFRGETITTALLDDFISDYERFSVLHISVNGFEPEVTEGALNTLARTEIARISCPYHKNGEPVFDIVKRILEQNHVEVFGKSGGAIIAGKRKNNYHAVPV